MATLVFTAVGQALGGPLGAALGSIVGRSIDDSLFGQGPRKGPRLGDLSVQTSSYGSMIPRIYGRMRVAGTVVWATDLIEEETVEGGGKGAPASQGYKYSVSLAVALSSRPVQSVGRIWADGKLIRGADGDFKVRTDFRLLGGDEDQTADPLIASIETIAETPAYRGVALAIFEGLELGEFGNRIPQLTFETEADTGPIDAGQLAGDIGGFSAGGSGETTSMAGYAAYGSSRREALTSLASLAGSEICDDGETLRLVGEGEPVAINDEQLGCTAETDQSPRLERRREAGSRTAALSMTYYEPDRDFQVGQVRVSGGSGGERDEREELPAALDATVAKGVAERMMHLRQAGGDAIVVRLPPEFMTLAPGDMLALPELGQWQVAKTSVEGLAVVAELHRPARATVALPTDGGRATGSVDLVIGETMVALFEIPSIPGFDGPMVAASNQGLWKPVPVELAVNGQVVGAVLARRKAVLGQALDVLGDAASTVVDRRNSVTVQLADPDQQLFNADTDAIDAGANLAMLGRELVQFRQAVDLGEGRWLLRHFQRGCRGTEWTTAGHIVGELFCLLGAGLTPADRPELAEGASLRATANGIADHAPLPSAGLTYEAEQGKPPSPCRLAATVSGTDLLAEWTARSWGGFGWSDMADVEGYPVRLTIDCGGIAIELDVVGEAVSVPLDDIPGSGPRDVSLSLVAIANGRRSRSAALTISI